MSYINKKTRVFMDRGDLRPERRRSEARMKKYPSTIDIRAWCDFVEDRRQHILELVVQNVERCMGKLVPVDVILDILLGKYKNDIANLKKCLNMLWDFIKKLDLNDDERKQLTKITNNMPCREFLGNLVSLKSSSGIDPQMRMARMMSEDLEEKLEEKPAKCVAQERHARELAEVEDLVGKGTYSVKIHGPGKVRTRIKGIQPGFFIASDGAPTPGGIKVKAQNGRADVVIKNCYPRTKQDPGSSHDEGTSSKPKSNQSVTKRVATKSEPLSMSPKQEPSNERPSSHISKRSASSPPKPSSPHNSSAADATVKHKSATPEHEELSARRGVGLDSDESFEVGKRSPRSGSPGAKSGSPRSNSPRSNSPRSNSPMREPALEKEMSGSPARQGDDGEAAKLRDQLAAREALCNELQVNVESLKNERDELQQKLDSCLKEIENFKKLNAVANPVVISASCQEEIEALEVEIKLMRSGNLSPEQEADVIKKEVDVLKRYCSKLRTIEDENENLKRERDTLKSQVAIAVESTESDEIPSKMEELDEKLHDLEEMTKERDALASKVKELEEKLKQYENLPEDIEDLRQRSGMLDSVLEERDTLSKKASQIKEMENEINLLRQKADRVDELERELKAMSKYDRSSGYELRKSISKCSNLERELANIHAEKEAMSKRLDSMRRESESYRCRAKECEMLKLERDRLQIKLNELADIQMQYDSMIANMKMFDGMKAERDMYKQKYEEVLQMECQCEMLKSQLEAAQNLGRERDALQRQVGDLESCICEQEDEIKRLVCQVDNMAKNKDESNHRMKDALANMRAEIEKKDTLIAESEERLAAVQSQVRNSMQGVTNEAGMLRRKVNDLEMQLQEKNCYIKCLENKLKEREGMLRNARGNQYDNVDAMRRELEAAKAENRKLQEIANKMMTLSGDEHVRKMLKQSECAVRRIVEELGKQYREWDNMRHKHQKARQTSSIKDNCCCRHPATDFPISASCEKLKEEMDIIQREKEKLETIVKQLQASNMENPQGEMAALRREKANLQEQLERERRLRMSLEKKVNV